MIACRRARIAAVAKWLAVAPPGGSAHKFTSVKLANQVRERVVLPLGVKRRAPRSYDRPPRGAAALPS